MADFCSLRKQKIRSQVTVLSKRKNRQFGIREKILKLLTSKIIDFNVDDP